MYPSRAIVRSIVLCLNFILPIGLALAAGPLEFDQVDGSKIVLKHGGETPEPRITIETKLKEMKFMGILRGPTERVWVLAAGKLGNELSAESHIFAFPSDKTKSTHFSYPGKILDPKTRATLFESRAFFGKCMTGPGEEYIVFQRERLDRKRSLQPSVFIAKPGPTYLTEEIIERRLPNIQTTLKLVKSKQCFEIEGRNRLMLRKAMDLKPRRGMNDEEEEEEAAEETPKENQTDQELPNPEGPDEDNSEEAAKVGGTADLNPKASPAPSGSPSPQAK